MVNYKSPLYVFLLKKEHSSALGSVHLFSAGNARSRHHEQRRMISSLSSGQEVHLKYPVNWSTIVGKSHRSDEIIINHKILYFSLNFILIEDLVLIFPIGKC